MTRSHLAIEDKGLEWTLVWVLEFAARAGCYTKFIGYSTSKEEEGRFLLRLVCCVYDRLVACFSAANGCVSAQHYVGRAVLREIWSALRQTLFEDSSKHKHSLLDLCRCYSTVSLLSYASSFIWHTDYYHKSIAMSQYDSDLVATLEKASTGGTSRFHF